MQIMDRLVGILAPHTCLVCSAEGSLLCNWCLNEALDPVPERCYRCKKLSKDSAVCKSCKRSSKLKYVWVRSNYAGLAKDLVYHLKFGRAQAAAYPMSQLIDESAPWLSPDTLIVHMPTASSRRRQRGYDHAELLASHFTRLRGLKHETLLARLGQTRQVGANRETRLKQLKDSFRSQKTHMIRGAHVLLIDDIVTSGGSLEAAASILKKAGAKSVSAAVFAQKQ